MNKIEYRAYIKGRAILGIKPAIIHQELVSISGLDAPSYSTVTRWVKAINEGREEIEDSPRSGRPVTAFTSTNIDRVRQVVEDNPHATYDEIEVETLINRFTIFEIIHHALRLKKITSRYVPYELSDENKQKRVDFCRENLAYYRDGPRRLSDILTGDETQIYHRQIGCKSSNASWVGEGEYPKTIVRRGNFDAKTLFCIFFRTTGPVLIHAVNKGETMNNIYYINNCLAPALEVIMQQRTASGVKNIGLLHDNARPHMHSNVYNFLQENGIKIIKHPPYSPDLAPSDFWLFDYIKRNLDDQKDQKSLEKAVTKIVNAIPVNEYKKTLNKWIERLELCVKNNGEYFEHLIK